MAKGLLPLSFIRTMTVGSGIAPDLLTPTMSGARGLMGHPIYRRWGMSPRPESVPDKIRQADMARGKP